MFMKISISEYAKLCGVSKQTIYRRTHGLLKAETHQGVMFIDTELYPPTGKRKAGRPLIKSI